MTDWTCPRCERRFARRNQTHACARHTVEEHLAGAGPVAIETFHAFCSAVQDCGPFELAPTRAQIGFRVRRIFAGVVPGTDRLTGYLDLPLKLTSPRFVDVADYTDKLWVHHFVLRHPDELDDEFAGWIHQSYRVGTGDYLQTRPPP